MFSLVNNLCKTTFVSHDNDQSLHGFRLFHFFSNILFVAGSSLNIPRDAVRRHILSSSISTDARLPDNRLASVTGEGSIEGVASLQTGEAFNA